jgi:WD40 repeat protein
MWDLNTCEVVQKLQGHHDVVLSVSIHPDSNVIVSSGVDKDSRVIIWKLGEVRDGDQNGTTVGDNTQEKQISPESTSENVENSQSMDITDH